MQPHSGDEVNVARINGNGVEIPKRLGEKSVLLVDTVVLEAKNGADSGVGLRLNIGLRLNFGFRLILGRDLFPLAVPTRLYPVTTPVHLLARCRGT